MAKLDDSSETMTVLVAKDHEDSRDYVLHVIRSMGYRALTASIPILAVTGLAVPGDRERCLVAGCDDYLSKPFTPKELATKVDELLAREEPVDPPSWIEICRVSEGSE